MKSGRGTRLYCPEPCRRFLGYVPAEVVWTGSVKKVAFPLDERAKPIPDGLVYVNCSNCKAWQRFEVTPPSPVAEIIPAEKQSAA